MNKDREIVEALGGKWHSHISQKFMDEDNYFGCSCGNFFPSFVAIKQHIGRKNPDFTSDAGKVQLLRELSKREDWHEFICYMIPVKNYDSYILSAIDIVKYILDTTGKLRDQAIKWLREEATDECNG